MPRKKYVMIEMISALTILLLWYLVSNYTDISSLFLPTPQKILSSFIEICKNGYKNNSLAIHLGTSLLRLMIAYIIAIITAVPLGLLSGYVPEIRAVIDPIINFYRPLPPLAYYTLLVLWMGIGNESKVLLLFLACFAPIYVTCSSSVAKIEANYIYNAESLGASKKEVFMTVIFPFVLTDLFSSLRTALGAGYTTLVAAEMVAARSGIGWMVLDASNYLRSDIVFMGIIVMGITGIFLDKCICLLEKVFVPWKGKGN